MKKLLLFFITICFFNVSWGQIGEYQDGFGNGIEFELGQFPDFVEFDGKIFFVASNGSPIDSDFIFSIDQNNDLSLEFGLTDGNQYDIQALTVYNNQLYFAMANLSASPSPYRLFRLSGVSTSSADLLSTSVSLSDAFFGKMIVFNNELFFSGKLNDSSGNSTQEVGLINYNPTSGFSQINSTISGQDFIARRFTIRENNVLYFFDETAVDPITFERTYRLFRLDIFGSNYTLSGALGSVDWVGVRAPGLGAFDEFLFIIGSQPTDAEESLYRLSVSSPFQKLNFSGITSGSFVNAVNVNDGAVIYNNNIALLRRSITNGDVDRILLLSANGTPTEYDIQNVSAASLFGELNGSLLFSGYESGKEEYIRTEGINWRSFSKHTYCTTFFESQLRPLIW